MWEPTPDADLIQPVWTSDGVPSAEGIGEPTFYLYAQPIPRTVPVFAMEDTRTGQVFAKLDPYELCPTAPYANPLPAKHEQYALYQNRVVYYQYQSPGQLKELPGCARREASPSRNIINILLPGRKNSSLNLWVPKTNNP